MATTVWTTLDPIWCDRAQDNVVLSELRVLPEGFLRQGNEFRVNARRCSYAVQCNMAGASCQWAFTNPEFDPLSPG
jgi:hypothetical protein